MTRKIQEHLPIGRLFNDGPGWFVIHNGVETRFLHHSDALAYAKENFNGRGQDRTEEARHYTG
jgi:hypothetical protein